MPSFQLPKSNILIDTAAKKIPQLLQDFAASRPNHNGVKIEVQTIEQPVIEPRYGTIRWTMKIENSSRAYQGNVTVFGSLNKEQKIDFFTLNGVRHEETKRIFADFAELEQIFTLSEPILNSHPSY